MNQKSALIIRDLGSQESSIDNSELRSESHDPRDLEDFLPWACKLFNASRDVKIQKFKIMVDNNIKSFKGSTHTGTESLKFASRLKPFPVEINKASFVLPLDPKDMPVLLETTYTDDNLIQLRFNKCYHIPCQLYLILIKIAGYHPFLTKLVINSGVDATGLVYIGKLLVESNITEVILDGCYVREGNYYILLEEPGRLSYLSLARCRINDDIVQKCCAALEFNSAASKTLSVLNLSSNEITDVGAEYIGYCLRTNRKLKHINLANNKITDRGAKQIFKSFTSFELNAREIHTHYSILLPELLTLCNDMHRIMKELKTNTTLDNGKYGTINRKSYQMKRPKLSRRSLKSGHSLLMSAENFSNRFKEAVDMYKSSHHREPSVDYTYPEFTKQSNGKFLASGNNTLCSLNLAYNQLTYFSLQYILNVLNFQNKGLSPNGLVRLQLDGNPLPKICQELKEIDRLLNHKLDQAVKNLPKVKRSKVKDFLD